MDRPLDSRDFVEQILAQRAYHQPLQEGQYLGFLIPGERVIMRRIDELIAGKSTEVVARSVHELFEQ